MQPNNQPYVDRNHFVDLVRVCTPHRTTGWNCITTRMGNGVLATENFLNYQAQTIQYQAQNIAQQNGTIRQQQASIANLTATNIAQAATIRNHVFQRAEADTQIQTLTSTNAALAEEINTLRATNDTREQEIAQITAQMQALETTVANQQSVIDATCDFIERPDVSALLYDNAVEGVEAFVHDVRFHASPTKAGRPAAAATADTNDEEGEEGDVLADLGAAPPAAIPCQLNDFGEVTDNEYTDGSHSPNPYGKDGNHGV